MDRKTIDKLTHLSKLSIPENDVDELIINLENILKLIGEIDAAPTEGMEPMAHPLDFNQPLREDRPCLLYTSPSPRDLSTSRMPSSA